MDDGEQEEFATYVTSQRRAMAEADRVRFIQTVIWLLIAVLVPLAIIKGPPVVRWAVTILLIAWSVIMGWAIRPGRCAVCRRWTILPSPAHAHKPVTQRWWDLRPMPRPSAFMCDTHVQQFFADGVARIHRPADSDG